MANRLAIINWESPSYEKGDILEVLNGTSIPLELVLHEMVSFHGQILFKEPVIKPINIAKV